MLHSGCLTGLLIRLWGKKLEKFSKKTSAKDRSHPDVFLGKSVLKNAANLQENSHGEVRFQ